MIIERKKVIAAYVRALLLGGGHEQACRTAASVLAIPIDSVLEVIRTEYTATGDIA